MSREALEPIGNGMPVHEAHDGLTLATSWSDMTGIAKRAGTDDGWSVGDQVEVVTDGGLLTVLPWPLDVNGGRFTRSAYCTISNGKIIDAR